MLQIQLLGQFEIRADGKRISIASRPGQSLFAFLVLTAGTVHRREKLAGMIWPDTSDENARKNLRHELWRIRKALAGEASASPAEFLARTSKVCEPTVRPSNVVVGWQEPQPGRREANFQPREGL